jgi:hypothetical protein
MISYKAIVPALALLICLYSENVVLRNYKFRSKIPNCYCRDVIFMNDDEMPFIITSPAKRYTGTAY